MELKTITKEGRTIAFLECGNGKPILCFSGFGCTHFIYEDLVNLLKDKFKFIIVDNRGMGKSTPTTTDYQISDLAIDAKFVLDQLQIEKVGVAGISMGGFIAQEFCSMFPELVSSLALLCTTSIGADFIHPKALTEEGLRQFATLDPQMAAEYSTIGTTHPSLKAENPERFQHIVNQRIKNRTNVDEQIRQNKAAINFLNSNFDISKIKCPTLAMCGDQDRFVSPKNIEAFKINLNKCVTTTIPDTDHFFFMEKPEMVAAHLENFFKETL